MLLSDPTKLSLNNGEMLMTSFGQNAKCVSTAIIVNSQFRIYLVGFVVSIKGVNIVATGVNGSIRFANTRSVGAFAKMMKMNNSRLVIPKTSFGNTVRAIDSVKPPQFRLRWQMGLNRLASRYALWLHQSNAQREQTLSHTSGRSSLRLPQSERLFRG